MTLDDIIKILLSAGTLGLGAFLTAVRGKLATTKEKNKLHYIFYVVAGLIFITAVVASFMFWNELAKPNWLGIIAIAIATCASIALFWFTKRYLAGKYQYTTPELDPIVNNFTKNADDSKIKLLAGDLNFFGSTTQEMDLNSQYSCLKNSNFRSVQILCSKPISTIEKIRYGKILSDLRVELKYYNPPHADLGVRGRIKTLNRVPHLLIYNKIKSGLYEALEMDTANSHGVLYDHIWNLIWELAEAPHPQEIDHYKKEFKQYLQ